MHHFTLVNLFILRADSVSQDKILQMEPQQRPNTQTRKNVLLDEYLLQGTVLDESCEALLHKLRGFCDNSEEKPHKFQDHEMVYTISKFVIFFMLLFNILQCSFFRIVKWANQFTSRSTVFGLS